MKCYYNCQILDFVIETSNITHKTPHFLSYADMRYFFC